MTQANVLVKVQVGGDWLITAMVSYLLHSSYLLRYVRRCSHPSLGWPSLSCLSSGESNVYGHDHIEVKKSVGSGVGGPHVMIFHPPLQP